MPRPIPLPDELMRRPFLVAEALRLGISQDVLRGARLRRPFRGVRVPAHLRPSLELRCQAAALVMPHGSAFSHTTAAALHGLPDLGLRAAGRMVAPTGTISSAAARAGLPTGARPVLEPTPTAVHVTTGATWPRVRGIRAHRGTLAPSEVVRRPDGLTVTTVARTWVDLAAALDLVGLVVVADAALRRGVVSLDQLESSVRSADGRRGVRTLRQAVQHVEAATDSPMETRLRMLLVLAGLPRPVANRDVVVDGCWLARPDLAYVDQKIAIEFDGDHHRTDRRQWRSDIARRRLLEDAGWRVLVFTADDVLRRPDLTVGSVRRCLADRRP